MSAEKMQCECTCIQNEVVPDALEGVSWRDEAGESELETDARGMEEAGEIELETDARWNMSNL